MGGEKAAWQIGHKCLWRPMQIFESGSGSVGRAVSSNSRGPRFESSHWQILYWTFVYFFTINCIENTKINKKRPGMAHIIKNSCPNFPKGAQTVVIVVLWLKSNIFKMAPKLAKHLGYFCRKFITKTFKKPIWSLSMPLPFSASY